MTARWVASGAILALLPKCPMCLAAYIAVALGVGIPAAIAMFAKPMLVVLCAVLLLYPRRNRC
jgi:hypothetical protein